MAYHEEEQLKLKRLNSKQAISLAMQGKWQDAIGINQSILNTFPDDVDAYNRLGRAYMEMGVFIEAKKAYEQSIRLDPYNSIAKKNLQRLAHLGEAGLNSKEHVHKVEPQFIEEAGKSGVVSLQRLASPKVLVRLVAGDKVLLKIDENNIKVKSNVGDYIGQLEPKHAQRLIRLVQGGNRYAAAIISAAENKVTIIIKETYQDPSLVGQPSFPPRWAEGLHNYGSNGPGGHHWEEEEELEEVSYHTEEESESPSGEYSSGDETESEE